MKIRLYLFAGLAEAMGGNSLDMELSETTLDVGALIQKLSQHYPASEKAIRHAMVVVNKVYTGPDYQIKEDDEVALIPPLSGG